MTQVLIHSVMYAPCSIVSTLLFLLLRATWYQLITSLAVSDLISTIISPFLLYNYTWGFEFWRWTDALCKVSVMRNVSKHNPRAFPITRLITSTQGIHFGVSLHFTGLSPGWTITAGKLLNPNGKYTSSVFYQKTQRYIGSSEIEQL